MAKFFGKRSAYLVRCAVGYRIVAVLYVFILIALVYISVQMGVKLENPLSWATLFVLFFPFIVYCYAKYKKSDYESNSFFKGLFGEEILDGELKKKLGDEYSVFSDVKIDSKFGNIDFVVVGLKGVFTLEVKSHRGNIGFDGQQLTRNGNPFEKNILSQAMAEALSLHDFLHEKLGADVFIKPIIVFSNYTKIPFGLNSQKNVFVIGKSWLNKLFDSQPNYYFPVDRSFIEHELMTIITPQSQRPRLPAQ